MEEHKILNLSENYLNNTIQEFGKKLVGKVCKRFETILDHDVLKTQVKELIYEEVRNFRDILLAFNEGTEIKWEFKSKSKEFKND
jgi:hypothetical protein